MTKSSVLRIRAAIDFAPQRVEQVIEFDAALKHHPHGADVLDALAGRHVVIWGQDQLLQRSHLI